MEKNKLIEMRKFKGFSQQQIAEQLCIGVSTYNRREKGQAPINIEQWKELAKVLDVPLEEIFEPDEKQVFICKYNAAQSYQGTNNIYTVSESLIETQQKYITKLEEENATLKHLLEQK